MLAFAPAMAKQSQDEVLPETDGIYEVKGHPELKLRVFVYKARPEPSPVLGSPVCGLDDPLSDAKDAPAGWTLPSSWTYSLNPSSVPTSVGGNNFAAIASKAFSAWTGALSGKANAPIIQKSTTDTSATRAVRDGQNIIAWGRTSGSALAITYTWYNTTTKKAVEIDTIMNQKFPWAWSDPNTWGSNPTCAFANAYDAQDILTHELGHTFGLTDHYTSAYTNNTMYGYGSKQETKKDTLTNGDVSGVQALY